MLTVTDPKLDNIILGFEDDTVLPRYIRSVQRAVPEFQCCGNRRVHASQNDFGPLSSHVMVPQLSDFGLAQIQDGNDPLAYPIQPDGYTAPELLLG